MSFDDPYAQQEEPSALSEYFATQAQQGQPMPAWGRQVAPQPSTGAAQVGLSAQQQVAPGGQPTGAERSPEYFQPPSPQKEKELEWDKPPPQKDSTLPWGSGGNAPQGDAAIPSWKEIVAMDPWYNPPKLIGQ